MARKKVKVKDYERLDDSTVGRVVSLLEDKKPITKKEACEILNISYNTARLNKIVENYKDKKAFAEKRRKENLRKPLDDYDKKYVVKEYLRGRSNSAIANDLFRPVTHVNNFIEEIGLPKKVAGATYWTPSYITDETLSKEYTDNEIVWAARYNCVAEIMKKLKDTDDGPIYSLWVYGKKQEFAVQPWWELGKLTCLDELGLTVDDLKLSEDLRMEYR